MASTTDRRGPGREAARKGGLARARQFTRESQQYARSHVRHENVVRAARAGARATLQKHGAETLVGRLVEYRLAHPTRPELSMIALLDKIGHPYQRECPVDAATLLRLDFGDPELRWGIEVRGDIHDIYDDPEREAARLARIQAGGWMVLVVPEPALVNSAGGCRWRPGLERDVRAFIASVAVARLLGATSRDLAPDSTEEVDECGSYQRDLDTLDDTPF